MRANRDGFMNLVMWLLKGVIAYALIIMWQALFIMYPLTTGTMVYMMIVILIWRYVRQYHITIIIGEGNVRIDSKR